ALAQAKFADNPIASGFLAAGVARQEGMRGALSPEEQWNVEKKFVLEVKQVFVNAWKDITAARKKENEKQLKDKAKADAEEMRLLRQRLSAETEISNILTNDGEMRYQIELQRISTLVEKWNAVADDLTKAGERLKAERLRVSAAAAEARAKVVAGQDLAISGNDFWAGLDAQVARSSEELGKWGAMGARAAETMESSMATLFSSIMRGTKTAKEAFKDFIGSIGDAFANEVAKMIAQMVMLELRLATGTASTAYGDKKSLILQGVGLLVGMFGGTGGGGAGTSTSIGADYAGETTMGRGDLSNISTRSPADRSRKAEKTVIEFTLNNYVTDKATAQAMSGKAGRNVFENFITSGAAKQSKIRKAIKQAAS
ncbi:MAG TPA: hypothetical protein VMW24_05215, partial [Sedimentisphaerales bacterium]|nr:hypothetical protein [Sedimentisphaerales bacterium]